MAGEFSGDAVDVALLELAQHSGLAIAALRSERRQLAALPYEPARRFAATLDRCRDGAALIHVKGGDRDRLRTLRP